MDATSPVIITAYRLKFGMTEEMLARALNIDTQELEAIESSDRQAPEWLRIRIIKQFGWFDFEAFAESGEPKELLWHAGRDHPVNREEKQERLRWAGYVPPGEDRLPATGLYDKNRDPEDYAFEMQCAAIRPEAVTALRYLLRMSLGEFSRLLGIPGKELIEHETGKRIVSAHLVGKIQDKLEINLLDFEKSDFAQDVITGEGPYSMSMRAR